MTGTLIFVVGPSGVGKDTLLDGARAWLEGDSRFHFLKRDITRPASAGGEDHNPVSTDLFAEKLKHGEYALHWGAHDLRYGLPHRELAALAQGKSVIANGSRSVLDEARAIFDHVAIISITANEALLRQRLLARGRESAADIEKRIARATAFNVSGEDVHTISNDGSVEEGVAYFVELLAKLDGRLFTDRRSNSAPKPRRGVYLIARREGKVLFAYTDEYNLPGGGIEGTEQPLDALAREVMEETGCRLIGLPQHICDGGEYHAPEGLPEWHKISRYYVGDVEKVAEPIEHDHTPVWVDPAEVWEQLSLVVRFALTQAAQQVPETSPAR